ncbi:hypothetical protein B0H15DRAFT_788279 [Mycena belliarum]|uniref:Uncharacterized protein n=1 Tax=Mycena belliarum TaxID=1033014 RepID=A0AAD6XPP8_9AGAR|nr:hypothetical protein B0H15DRAFT_788279 [Mycena belliae]
MDHPVESEMSQHQRNLVDLCLEEGQYEAAIDILAQLRSPNHKPSSAHVRQLLFMALYSAGDRGQDRPRVDLSASPSKRQKRSHLLPSHAASLASQQLLVSFATTNTPAAVIRPLRPSDPEPEDDNECFVATESMCISRCKNCWQILVEGFLDRNQPLLSTPKAKGKRRGDTSFTDLSEVRAPIGETAWSILDWLLLLFERDERANPTLPRHSPLLLEQLGSPARRDTDPPLAIILHCLQQSDERRRMMGSRLMNLLINLSFTTQLDFPMLVVSVFNRLSTSSLDDISSLFDNLSPSLAVSKFKIALYQRYFGESSDAPRIATGVRPKPQVRAQPKGSPTKIPDPPQPVSLVNRHRVPSSAEILRLMKADLTTPVNPAVSAFRIKFELLVSYNLFQTLAAPADVDPEWPNLLRTGVLEETLDAVFGCKDATAAGECATYRILLDTILISDC